MPDLQEERDDAAVDLAQGICILACGFIMIFFAGLSPASSKDWLWLGFSGLVLVVGIAVFVRSCRRLWAVRRNRNW